MSEQFDIIIVGGGPAGLTAAVYARRAGKSVLLLEKESFGGQIASSPKVENFPGFAAIPGAELADRFYAQAEALGARIELEEVLEVRPGTPHTVITDYNTYTGTALILANGVKHRMLGLPGEEELVGRGLSFCAVCDGAFYAGRETAMVGGGNSALQEALLLSEVCSKVTVVQNLPAFTGEATLAQALLAKENVEVLFNTTVSEYLTEQGEVTGLKLFHEATGAQRTLRVDGVFLAVGLQPKNEAFAALAELDRNGYYDTDEFCATKTPGVYVAGDCRRKFIRQVTTAAADGTVAATQACTYVDCLRP